MKSFAVSAAKPVAPLLEDELLELLEPLVVVFVGLLGTLKTLMTESFRLMIRGLQNIRWGDLPGRRDGLEGTPTNHRSLNRDIQGGPADARDRDARCGT